MGRRRNRHSASAIQGWFVHGRDGCTGDVLTVVGAPLCALQQIVSRVHKEAARRVVGVFEALKGQGPTSGWVPRQSSCSALRACASRLGACVEHESYIADAHCVPIHRKPHANKFHSLCCRPPCTPLHSGSSMANRCVLPSRFGVGSK